MKTFTLSLVVIGLLAAPASARMAANNRAGQEAAIEAMQSCGVNADLIKRISQQNFSALNVIDQGVWWNFRALAYHCDPLNYPIKGASKDFEAYQPAQSAFDADTLAAQYEAFKACGIEDAKPLKGSGLAVIDPITVMAAGVIRDKCAEEKR